MLSGFWPSQDQVGLLAFPGMTSATVSKDYTCPTSNPTIVSYGNLTPAPVYQIVGLSTDYKTSDATTSLNPTSNVVKAVGGASGCSGIKAPGGEGTFYADAITAAQLTLTTTGRAGVQKAIIMVTDGDASASAPSQITTALGTNECHEAITAAQVAKTAGTWIYTVSYGSPSSGCSTDKSPSITPCAALAGDRIRPDEVLRRYHCRLPCRSQRDIGAEQPVQEHRDQPDLRAHAARQHKLSRRPESEQLVWSIDFARTAQSSEGCAVLRFGSGLSSSCTASRHAAGQPQADAAIARWLPTDQVFCRRRPVNLRQERTASPPARGAPAVRAAPRIR